MIVRVFLLLLKQKCVFEVFGNLAILCKYDEFNTVGAVAGGAGDGRGKLW
jgi:hypothetical protein